MQFIVQFMHTLFVYDEEMGWGIQGYSLYLTTNKKVAIVAVWCKNAHACKNFSRNFGSGPISFQLRQIVHVRTIVA